MNNEQICNYIFSKLQKCLEINITVFGKKDGIDMCQYMKKHFINNECDLDLINDANFKILVDKVDSEITDFR